MEKNKKHLNVMKIRRILFVIFIIVMISEAVFTFLMIGEQQKFEDWFDNYINTKKSASWTGSENVLYSFWKWSHFGALGFLAILAVGLGINTFSKSKEIKITKVIAALMAAVAVLLLIFSTIDISLSKAPEIAVTSKNLIGVDTATPMVAENKEIATGFNSFLILSKKGIILTSLSAIISLTLFGQSYLIDLMDKKAKESLKLAEKTEEKKYSEEENIDEYSEEENIDEYHEEEIPSEYHEEEPADTYTTI